jgi:hypothetical protein
MFVFAETNTDSTPGAPERFDDSARPHCIGGVLDELSQWDAVNLIPTEGWLPVDAKVCVGDVAALVSKLGGHELYGKDSSAQMSNLARPKRSYWEGRFCYMTLV